MKILVVEDSKRLRKGIASALRHSGYAVDTAADGNEGLWAAQSNPYDTLVLDIMLPGIDGLEILRRLREQDDQTPILLLTARDTIPDRVLGLRSGADDYLVKPFALEELLARIEVLCRRAYYAHVNPIEEASLRIDPASRRVHFKDNELSLTSREFALIEYLARRKGEVVSRTEIEEHIYDAQVEPLSNVVDAAIYALRKKLKQAGAPPVIHTRRGIGYVFEHNPTPSS